MKKPAANNIVQSAPLALDGLDLKDACVVAAQAVIAEHGVEKLSLRDIARRLNVSHQAPYKHYPSRDHLLAAVIGRCFNRFTEQLNQRERSDQPMEDLRSLGAKYLEFALANPLEYRLMFGSPWPEVDEEPGLVKDCRHAFNVLREALQPMYPADSAAQIDADAMFIWSTMHGVASILQSKAVQHLALSGAAASNFVQHAMDMIELAVATRLSQTSAPNKM